MTFSQQMPTAIKTKICIIGGGISGITTAHLLASLGCKVTLIDQASKPMQGASNHKAVVLFTKPSLHSEIFNQFQRSAYDCAINATRRLALSEGSTPSFIRSGVFYQLPSQELEPWQAAIKSSLPKVDHHQDHHYLKKDWLQLIKNKTKFKGIPGTSSGIWLPQSGYFQPLLLANSLLSHSNIECLWERKVVRIEQQKNKLTLNQWKVFDQQGNTIQAETLIICNALNAKQLLQDQILSVRPIAGQVTHLPAKKFGKSVPQLETILTGTRYLLPEIDDEYLTGASYHLNQDRCDHLQDHLSNITALKALTPTFYTAANSLNPNKLTGTAGVRAASLDYLPLVGPLPDTTYFHEQHRYHKKHRQTLNKSNPILLSEGQFIPNLWLNIGHGSKGFTQAWISAELLASYVLNKPFPCNLSSVLAVHPGRFLIRQLKKAPEHQG